MFIPYIFLASIILFAIGVSLIILPISLIFLIPGLFIIIFIILLFTQPGLALFLLAIYLIYLFFIKKDKPKQTRYYYYSSSDFKPKKDKKIFDSNVVDENDYEKACKFFGIDFHDSHEEKILKYQNFKIEYSNNIDLQKKAEYYWNIIRLHDDI